MIGYNYCSMYVWFCSYECYCFSLGGNETRGMEQRKLFSRKERIAQPHQPSSHAPALLVSAQSRIPKRLLADDAHGITLATTTFPRRAQGRDLNQSRMRSSLGRPLYLGPRTTNAAPRVCSNSGSVLRATFIIAPRLLQRV